MWIFRFFLFLSRKSICNEQLTSLIRIRVMEFNATLNYISVIYWQSVLSGGGNRCIRWKPPNCRKALTNMSTLCYIEHDSSERDSNSQVHWWCVTDYPSSCIYNKEEIMTTLMYILVFQTVYHIILYRGNLICRHIYFIFQINFIVDSTLWWTVFVQLGQQVCPLH